MPSEHFPGGDLHTLLESVCAELRRRVLAGEDCRAESFLSAHPILASDPQLAIRLIESEIAARHERGETIHTAELLARFPQWHHHLLERLANFGFEIEPSRATDLRGDTDVYDTPGGRATTPEVPELGPHELGKVIARGGMGIVYRARDLVLGREVALKRIRADLMDSPESVQRFYREAHTVANLRHPNIVPIYGMGRHDGRHCFTMPLLTGGNLAEHRSRFQGDLEAAVTLMQKVARAVAAAHQENIIHRDLKPGNILLDDGGEPLVADFGLAKVPDGLADATHPGQRMGTAFYMPPEQAAGHSWRVTPASDVWSLGVMLYELLVGQRPFEATSAEEVVQQVLTAEVRRPREVRRDLPRDLDAVVMRCLQHDPAERYPNAGALADDLRRWLDRKPVQARREGWLRWSLRQGRRFRWVAVAVGLAALLLAAGYLLRPVDPDQPLYDIQARLARGERVDLIGSTGPPAWFRWVGEGAGAIVTPPQGDGRFTIDARRAALLALVADPSCAAYRFSARVRHTNDTRGGQVGLFFLYRTVEFPDRKDHLCWTWEFNGLTPRMAEGRDPPLTQYTVRESLVRIKQPGGWKVNAGTWQLIDPGGKAGPEFHQLAVEVRPDEIQLSWEDNPPVRIPWKGVRERFEEVRTWPDFTSLGRDGARYIGHAWSSGAEAQFHQSVAAGLGPWLLGGARLVLAGEIRMFPQMIDDFPGVPCPLGARGTLGLYVNSGQASFCNVFVEPLR
jgi:serine/threonine-protein kinase